MSVENLSFDHGVPAEIPPPTLAEQARKGIDDYSTVVRYGVLLTLFFLVYMLTIRPIQKRVLSGPNPLLAAARAQVRTEPELAPVNDVASSLAARSSTLKKQLAEFVKAEPESSSTAVRAWLREEAQMIAGPVEKLKISGARKTAILLTVLGEEAAAGIFRDLNPEDSQRVADELASLGAIPAELSIQVIEEYQRMTQAQDYLIQGGYDLARRLLIRAFARQKLKAYCNAYQGPRAQTPGGVAGVPIHRSWQVSRGRAPQTNRADPRPAWRSPGIGLADESSQ